MTVGVQTFCGQRLTEARLARGLHKNVLADLVGVSRQTISKYEDDKENPQAERLEIIAKQLAFPVAFFTRPSWLEALDLVLWRSRSTETKGAREVTEQRMYWLCELFAFLEKEVDFPAFAAPEVDLPPDFRLITSEAIEAAASAVREAWGLRHSPIPDMTLALENVGIPVVTLEVLSDKQDGFSFRSPTLGRVFVGINVYNVSAARARYDAAHELGHIVLHKHVLPQQSREPANHKLMEQQAHRFAGAILFPKNEFLREVRIPSLDYFSALKKKWGMSISAMIYRAYDLCLIDEGERAALYANMSRRGWRGALREPFDRPEDMPLERPRMLRRAVEVVIESGVFGRASLKEALALPDREIEQLAGLDEGYFSNGQIVSLVTPKRRHSFRMVDLESGNVLEFRSKLPK
jgi:Zn-dependent peptidase ImmA (M78 family)/transcriptional regulator with XRE-family HTH domain